MDVEVYRGIIGQNPLESERKRPFIEQIKTLVSVLEKKIDYKVAIKDVEFLVEKKLERLGSLLEENRIALFENGYGEKGGRETPDFKVKFISEESNWTIEKQGDRVKLEESPHYDPYRGYDDAMPVGTRLALVGKRKVNFGRPIDDRKRDPFDQRVQLGWMMEKLKKVDEVFKSVETMANTPSVKLQVKQQIEKAITVTPHIDIETPGLGNAQIEVDESVLTDSGFFPNRTIVQRIKYNFSPIDGGKPTGLEIELSRPGGVAAHVEVTKLVNAGSEKEKTAVHDNSVQEGKQMSEKWNEGIQAANLEMRVKTNNPVMEIRNPASFGWSRDQWELALKILELGVIPEQERAAAVVGVNERIVRVFKKADRDTTIEP